MMNPETINTTLTAAMGIALALLFFCTPKT